MHPSCRSLIVVLLLVLFAWQNQPSAAFARSGPPVTDEVVAVMEKVSPLLNNELAAKGFRLGLPVFIRIFKLPGQLEVWMEKEGQYRLFKTYSICSYSGYLGPKRQEGDWQSPEGFYSVTADRMNPHSSYHLAFNIGYPNEYDALLNRTGGNIMVHGNCSSMGCFAMSDYRMEEIYILVNAALANGQESVGVHIFPFPLTAENLRKYSASPWVGFWKNLKEGYDFFEQNREVPEIQVAQGRYVVTGVSRLAMTSLTK